MGHVHTHTIFDVITETVALCSFLHTVLPPWEAFNDFPSVQKYYKLFIYIIGYMALNARSTVYQNISVSNPTGPNANVPTQSLQTTSAEGQ